MYTLYSININTFDEKLKIHTFFKAKFDCKIKKTVCFYKYLYKLAVCSTFKVCSNAKYFMNSMSRAKFDYKCNIYKN